MKCQVYNRDNCIPWNKSNLFYLIVHIKEGDNIDNFKDYNFSNNSYDFYIWVLKILIKMILFWILVL